MEYWHLHNHMGMICANVPASLNKDIRSKKKIKPCRKHFKPVMSYIYLKQKIRKLGKIVVV